MSETTNRRYDLEDRTLKFAKEVIALCKTLPRNAVNHRLVGQLVGAVGSVGANYREANEALSKKDFIHRMKITRKECKEASYWLELLKEADGTNPKEFDRFLGESRELRNIFSAIIKKSD